MRNLSDQQRRKLMKDLRSGSRVIVKSAVTGKMAVGRVIDVLSEQFTFSPDDDRGYKFVMATDEWDVL